MKLIGGVSFLDIETEIVSDSLQIRTGTSEKVGVDVIEIGDMKRILTTIVIKIKNEEIVMIEIKV